MFFYSLIIVIALGLFYLSNITYKKSSIFYFFYSAFILLLSLLGGLRDYNVGTDVLGYGIIFFEDAKYAPNLVFLLKNVSGEWGFHTLMWICAKISDNVHFMFFVEEFIKIILVSSTALYYKDKINSILFIFTYLTFFYFTGFSAMRQLLAMSIFIYSLRFYFEGKHKTYILFCLLAMTFHSSAIFTLFVYVIKFIQRKNFKSSIVLHLVIVLFVYVFSITIMGYLMSNDFGIYSQKAELYTEREGAVTAKTNILLAVGLFITSFYYKFWKNNLYEYSIFIALIIYNIFFLYMSPKFEVAFRISWYQMPLITIIFLSFAKKYDNNKRRILNTILISLYSLHFIISATHGLSGTIPYSSQIIGV